MFMKILQIHKFHFLKGQAGGASRYFFDLTKLLQDNGHHLIPFSMKHPDNLATAYEKYFVSNLDLTEPKCNWQALKKIPRLFWSTEAAPKLELLIKKEKPEVAHLHNIYHHLSSSILPVLKKYHLPLVMTVHDFKLICPNYSLFDGIKVCDSYRCRHRAPPCAYYRCFLKKCVKNSYLASLAAAAEAYFQHWGRFYQKYIDLFLCPSQFVADKLLAAGFAADKIKVLPLFIWDWERSNSRKCFTEVSVSSLTYSSPSLEGRGREGEGYVSSGDRYCLYFGRLESSKGVDLLLEAAQLVPEAKLKIAGSGSQEAELKKQTAGLKNVEFLGWQEPLALSSLIKQAEFVVAPSRAYETFGLSALEAFSYSKPVIAANLGALPELVQHQKTGLLFKPDDVSALAKKIRYLWQRPQLARQLGEAAQKLALEEYSPEGHYQRLMKYYQQVKNF